MKVKIGKYLNYYGPFQIAHFLLFWKDKDSDVVYEFGKWLAGTENNNSWLSKLCIWLHSKRKRKIKVKVDNWDTWNLDNTLAHIILPALKQFRGNLQGGPKVDDSDVPPGIKSKDAPPVKSEFDTDEFWFKRWEYVLDEMIFAFEMHVDDEAESKFFDHSQVNPKDDLKQQISKIGYDKKGLEAFQKRKQNGFRLFGKYYRHLWS